MSPGPFRATVAIRPSRRAIQRPGGQQRWGSNEGRPMSSRPCSRRMTLAVACSVLALLAASPTVRAGGEAKGKFTGPWDLETLRRPPKVTVAEGGKTLMALYYEGE